MLTPPQMSAAEDEPPPEQIHRIGTVASILQLLKLPDGTVKVLVEGEQRAEVQQFTETEDSFSALVNMVESVPVEDREGEALMRSVLATFDQYVTLNMKHPPELLTSLAGIDAPGRVPTPGAEHPPPKTPS